MNKYRYLIIFAGLAMWLTSCNDDFLERGPLSNISDAYYWKSANDLKLYTNNFYSQDGLLPRYNDYGIIGPYTEDANNGGDTYIHLDYNKRMNGENTVPASGGGWSTDDWVVLRDINYFMDHYKTVDAPWTTVSQYVGEALFFRSIFYFNKLRRFGDVPWYSTTLNPTSGTLYDGRLPRNQVADSIMHDLDRAVEYLPARGTGSWTGRVTKETALALQARIALYEGTWERYHAKKNTSFKVTGSDGVKFIEKAASAANALMALAESNGFPALVNVGTADGYWSLFNLKDYSTNKEVLLWRKYSLADGLINYWVRYSFAGASRGLTKTMIDTYLCTDGKPIAVSSLYQGDSDLKTVVTNRDPRLNQTIYVDDGKHYKWKPDQMFTLPTFEGANESKTSTGYQLYKGHTADYTEYLGNSGSNACIYFRYAEVLLIYAEARAELGMITQQDIDNTINKLRLRVGMNNGLLDISNITQDPNWEFTGISSLLQEIRRERKVELACEGFRVDDIFRWAAADEIIVGKKPKGAVKQQWAGYPGATSAFVDAWNALQVDENGYIDPYKAFAPMNNGFSFNLGRDYLYPIPTNEITVNPKLGQNPGWN